MILGIRVEFLNSSTISNRQARVVICNHQSALDIALGAVICPPAILAIGKKEVVFIPVLNLIWAAFDFIRVDRKNHARAIAAISGVSDELNRHQRSLFISPEGTRTSDGEVGPFKKGAFRIASQAKVPICPVVFSGAFDLMPKGQFFSKKGRIRVQFLPPIDPTEFDQDMKAQGLDSAIEKVRQKMIVAQKSMD